MRLKVSKVTQVKYACIKAKSCILYIYIYIYIIVLKKPIPSIILGIQSIPNMIFGIQGTRYIFGIYQIPNIILGINKYRI